MSLGTSIPMALEQLAEVEAVRGEPGGVVVVREHLRQLVLEDREAARLHAHDRRARADVVAQHVQRLAQVALGQVEKAVVVERPAATDVPLGQDHVPAGRLERLHAGNADIGVEVVVEGVGPEHHPWSARVAGAAALREPALERHRREGGNLALTRHAGRDLRHPRQARRVRGEVHEPRHARADLRRAVDQAERVRVARPPPSRALEVVV